jgi:hypothetical protein
MVHHRAVRLQAIVPQNQLWEFLQEFGEQFSKSIITDFGEFKSIGTVDSYMVDTRDPEQMLIVFTVQPEEEDRAVLFLEQFSRQRIPVC